MKRKKRCTTLYSPRDVYVTSLRPIFIVVASSPAATIFVWVVHHGHPSHPLVVMVIVLILALTLVAVCCCVVGPVVVAAAGCVDRFDLVVSMLHRKVPN